MKKFLSILVCLCFLVSTASATLLNTTDQVLNSNLGLGGNAAVRAYNKVENFEAGSVLLRKFAQNPVILGGTAADGADLDPLDQFSDLSLGYTYKLSNTDWLAGTYKKTTVVATSIAYKEQKPYSGSEAGRWDSYNANTSEVLAVSYGKNVGNMVKGLYVGAEIANNTVTMRDYDKLNRRQANISLTLPRTKHDILTVSDPYTSIAVGGIYQLNAKSKVIASHKITNPRTMKNSGTYLDGSKGGLKYTEAIQPETTVGYVMQLNPGLEVGGTVQTVWDASYEEVGNRLSLGNSGMSTEMDVVKKGYNAYTAAVEYALPNQYAFVDFMKGLVFQGTFTNAKGTGVVYYDNDGIVDPKPVELTDTSLNVIKTMGAHTIIGGVARRKAFNPDAATITDESKFYVNYALAF